jgi:hypothetical protein
MTLDGISFTPFFGLLSCRRIERVVRKKEALKELIERKKERTKRKLVIFFSPGVAGKAAWKLDDPSVLAAERAERLAAVAEAARRKVANALDKKVRQLSNHC